MAYKVKLGDNAWHDISQPYVKIQAGQWRLASRLLAKLGDGVWHEYWPGRIIYIHTGTHYGMNVAACFGNPTSPGNYIFYNNGTIGGGVGIPALVTGSFPAGSTLTIINNGRIEGMGGTGGWYNYNRVGVEPTAGGTALRLDYPTHLDNTNGTIWGGGGGGGGSAEWGGSNDNNAPGAGGAGIPGGIRGSVTWRPGYTYGGGAEPTDTLGGWTAFDNGTRINYGGAPGSPGSMGTYPGGSYNLRQGGGGAGYWIQGVGNLVEFINPNSASIRGLQG